jgi:hypothetical protein
MIDRGPHQRPARLANRETNDRPSLRLAKSETGEARGHLSITRPPVDNGLERRRHD